MLAGALTGATTVVPAVAVATLAGDARRSSWALVVPVLTVVGYLASGAVAGARSTTDPYRHGAVATFALFATVQGVVAVGRLIGGEGLSPVALVFNSLLAASFGVVGAGLRRRVPSRIGHTGR